MRADSHRKRAVNEMTLPAPAAAAPPAGTPERWRPGHAPPHAFDRALSAAMSVATRGISPASILGAYADWLVHLAAAPAKQSELMARAARNVAHLGLYAACAPWAQPECGIKPLPQDHRFEAPEWRQWPFDVIAQSFLYTQQWAHHATRGVRGVMRHHDDVVTFMTRQWLDVFAPSNWLWTNPQVLRATFEEGGANLVRGARCWWQDFVRLLDKEPPLGVENFKPGENIACTPGKVILRNRLMEVLQYQPQTEEVRREPVLFVPSWILKYYILDLSPHNSLVRYLVERGHTVFMVSWRNPGSADRDLGMDDYLESGVLRAIEAVRAVCPQGRVNAVGYCLGGTLLSMAAALLARRGDERLASLTLLASELDFTEPGELGLFIDESQLAYLEDLMWQQGYLDGRQMAGTFQVLNSRDLIWSRMVREYLMGDRKPMTDLNAWNADVTRMPFRQHGEYLERLYLNNELAEGRYKVRGEGIALSDIRVPMFAVGTVRDTVSPWRSVFKMHHLIDTEITFCLTSGGHNVGVVNPPEPGIARSFQLATRHVGEPYVDPDAWQSTVPVRQGSWWPAWQAWLSERSGPTLGPPPMGAPDAGFGIVGDAPGEYVLVR